MAGYGGARPGAGRPPGKLNKKTLESRAKAAAAATGGLTPLDFMLDRLRDKTADFADRMDAAKAAAPYVHPRLSNIEGSGKDGAILVRVVTGLADE